MSIFHIFKIVQMILNGAKRLMLGLNAAVTLIFHIWDFSHFKGFNYSLHLKNNESALYESLVVAWNVFFVG